MNKGERKILGFKMHDYHILLHQLISIGVRPFLLRNVYTAITELCSFYHDLCARTIRVSDLGRLQAYIIIILCKLKIIFLHVFFSVMVHLFVYLPYETKVVGPISYS